MISGSLFSLNVICVLVIIMFVLLIVTIILLVKYIIRFRKYETKYNNIWAEFYKGNLEQDIRNINSNMKQTQEKCEETQMLCSEIDGKMAKCIQKVGIVKYDAYEKSNISLSFAIALLDSKDDGVVINSVYNRNFSNIYAKEVNKGEVKGNISDEEKEALRKAVNNKSFM